MISFVSTLIYSAVDLKLVTEVSMVRWRLLLVVASMGEINMLGLRHKTRQKVKQAAFIISDIRAVFSDSVVASPLRSPSR